MRLAWAIIGGIALGGGLAWWVSRDTPEQARAKHERATRAAAANAEDARPVLYRWRDANGVLQITEKPPKGRKYEKVDMEPKPGIEVHGDRQ
ncbi:MAG TPA: DUF4124 domain-containing protein [Lysobacter sp.]